jgi:hydroxyacylglutathione hydrolase
MDVIRIRTPGLGDTSYLLIHAGMGVLVDPQRDVDRFLEAAHTAGVRLRYVLETHLHNDYVSGGREAARRSGAELVLPAGAGVAFPHTPAFHLEEFGDRGLVIRPLHTPGHTPEHVSYLVLVDGAPVALFSGGSLLVGSAGRTDLLGPERARQLAVLQYGSLQRLSRLPEQVALFPTHGEGSFCTVTTAGRESSTIGVERRENPALSYPDAQAFADGQLAALGPFPRYYAHMGRINLLGPPPMPDRPVPELTPAQVRALAGAAHLIDGRPRQAFAAGHIPGALGIELTEQFGVWVGWLVPFNAPLVLVLNPDQDVREAATQLARIGYDDVRGVLRGLAAWREDGLPLVSFPLGTPAELAAALARGERPQVLDVRAPDEWRSSHLPGAMHRYLPDLVDGVPSELEPNAPVWVACASGHRAAIAAGLLERHGYRPVLLTGGGIPDVLARLAAGLTAG